MRAYNIPDPFLKSEQFVHGIFRPAREAPKRSTHHKGVEYVLANFPAFGKAIRQRKEKDSPARLSESLLEFRIVRSPISIRRSGGD